MKILCNEKPQGRPPKKEIKELKDTLTAFYTKEFQPLIRGLYDKQPTHTAGNKGSYDQLDIETSKTSHKELSSKENLPDKPNTRQKPSSQF